MREFGTDYLFRITVEPAGGYRQYQPRKKPYYVVAATKDEAVSRLKLSSGWKVKSVQLLAEQYSGVLFGSSNAKEK